MNALDPDRTKVLQLVLENAIMDYLNGPVFRGLQATLIKQLRQSRGYGQTDALKVAIEVQCAALRGLADKTEERSVELLRVSAALEVWTPPGEKKP